MTENHLLQRAIKAARAGHELTARDIFLQIVESEPQNEVAWMWLTGLLDDLDDRIDACEKVLEINSGNANARQYLDQLLAKKQEALYAERSRAEEQLQQVRNLIKSNKQDSALQLARKLTKNKNVNADAWRLIAKLAPGLDEQISALENLLTVIPSDVHAQKKLRRLRHFQKNPLDLAAMYEEKGDLDKAIATYGLAATKPASKQQWDSIYWKIARLENLRYENIAHISTRLSVARLTCGPAILYLLLTLTQVGINPFAHPEPLLWLGFFWVLLGGFMIAIATVRSHNRLWFILFRDAGSGGSPWARFAMAAAGWILVLLPHIMLLLFAFYRLLHFIR